MQIGNSFEGGTEALPACAADRADSTGRVLASIDGALDAWERGTDASRWHAGGDGPDELRSLPDLCAELHSEALREYASWLFAAITRAGRGIAARAFRGLPASCIWLDELPVSRTGYLGVPDLELAPTPDHSPGDR